MTSVAYPNPLEQWLWESGTIYWIYLIVGAPLLLILLILFILHGRLFIRSLRKMCPLLPDRRMFWEYPSGARSRILHTPTSLAGCAR